jgi:hypothetical protein
MCEVVLADTKRQSESKVVDQLIDGFADETDQSGDLGFEPSRESLGKSWTDVAKALQHLQMRMDQSAIILNQTWVRIANTFPCFSPAAIGQRTLVRRVLSLVRLPPMWHGARGRGARPVRACHLASRIGDRSCSVPRSPVALAVHHGLPADAHTSRAEERCPDRCGTGRVEPSCGVGLLPLRLRDSTRKAPSRYDVRTSHAEFENQSVVSDEWH